MRALVQVLKYEKQRFSEILKDLFPLDLFLARSKENEVAGAGIAGEDGTWRGKEINRREIFEEMIFQGEKFELRQMEALVLQLDICDYTKLSQVQK